MKMYVSADNKIELIQRILNATEHPLVKHFAIHYIVQVPMDEEAVADFGFEGRIQELLSEVSCEGVAAGIEK
jgi:hypothetical protein